MQIYAFYEHWKRIKKEKNTAIYYELIKLMNILDSSYIFAFIFL